MILRFLIIALALVGCFNPDYSKVSYTCDEFHGCPQETVCYQGICRYPWQIPIQAADGGADQSVMVMVDAAPASGCATGGGVRLSQDAWACPGLFTPGKVRAVCAAGYGVCKDASHIDLTACQRVTGFYIADVRGRDQRLDCTKDANAVKCDYQNQQESPLWFGCGAGLTYTPKCLRGCSGFTQALNGAEAAREPGPPFVDSYTPDLEGQRNNESLIGVLCCASQ